jgi:hypothetical protein
VERARLRDGAEAQQMPEFEIGVMISGHDY